MRLLFFLINKRADDYFQALGYLRHKSSVAGAASSSSYAGAQAGLACAQDVALLALSPLRVAARRNLPHFNMAYDESENNERHVDGVAWIG